MNKGNQKLREPDGGTYMKLMVCCEMASCIKNGKEGFVGYKGSPGSGLSANETQR